MPKVVCIGELLIDFCAAEKDAGLAAAQTFVKAPGGAPANVAVGLARLGVPAGFIGAVGNDPFGEFLEGVIRAEGVDTSGLARIDGIRTSLAFIANRSDGAKDICFYRNPGADMLLGPRHIDPQCINQADALHFGSISRIDDSPRAATDIARNLAASAGAMISYDPNWRPSLWPNASQAQERLREGFNGSHVVKISQEEWQFVTGADDFAAGAKSILAAGVELVVRSEGPDGASFASPRTSGHVDSFKIKCVEPTGAGDAFMACMIAELLVHWQNKVRPSRLDEQELIRIVRLAAACGAIACTKVGAIPSLPTRKLLTSFLARHAF